METTNFQLRCEYKTMINLVKLPPTGYFGYLGSFGEYIREKLVGVKQS
jgi:hypothetical protein